MTTQSGDTVDLSGLSCNNSTITLTTGTLFIPAQLFALTVRGPPTGLSITKTAVGTRVFNHFGTGTLRLEHLEVSGGNLTYFPGGTALGGCIYSKGNVTLDHSSVHDCHAAGGDGAAGGGVFANGNLTLHYATLSSNTAGAISSGNSSGGGAKALSLDADHSTISSNSAVTYAPFPAVWPVGGGFVSRSSTTLINSTVSGNHSDGNAGGFLFTGDIDPASTRTLVVRSSTVSGNVALHRGGGGFVYAEAVSVQNSTIAFNAAGYFNGVSAGLHLTPRINPLTVTLNSSLLSNNRSDAINADYDLSLPGATIAAASADNLIRVTQATGLPADTIKGACPRLGRLRDNGGPTPTHALGSGSAAIDQGGNPLSETQDQRGSPADPQPFAYPRPSGPQTDIGAYEVNQTVIIFNADFDGCVPVP